MAAAMLTVLSFRPVERVAVVSSGVAAGGPPAQGMPSLTPLRPGSYRYSLDGHAVTGSAGMQTILDEVVVTVEPTVGPDQRIVRRDPLFVIDTTVTYQSDGVYLRAITVATPAFTRDFVAPAAAPLLVFPVSRAPGSSWEWTVPSTDGASQLTAKFGVARAETVMAGGSSRAAVVITENLALTGDVVGSMIYTQWLSPDTGQLLQFFEVTDGHADGSEYRTDVRATFVSVDEA